MFMVLDRFNMPLPVFVKIMVQVLYLCSPRNNTQDRLLASVWDLIIYALQGNVANTNGLKNMLC